MAAVEPGRTQDSLPPPCPPHCGKGHPQGQYARDMRPQGRYAGGMWPQGRCAGGMWPQGRCAGGTRLLYIFLLSEELAQFLAQTTPPPPYTMAHSPSLAAVTPPHPMLTLPSTAAKPHVAATVVINGDMSEEDIWQTFLTAGASNNVPPTTRQIEFMPAPPEHPRGLHSRDQVEGAGDAPLSIVPSHRSIYRQIKG